MRMVGKMHKKAWRNGKEKRNGKKQVKKVRIVGKKNEIRGRREDGEKKEKITLHVGET